MIKVIELFSGIGSQHAALERLKQSYPDFQYKVIGVAEIDKDATLSYSAIHHDLTNKLKRYDYPSAEEMRDYLQVRNIGYDFKKNKPYSWKNLINKITQKPKKDLQKYYLASKLANNYGDISKIDKLPKADFWTYSFPCQDLSVAGKQKGLGEGTRSGLLYEVERLLEVSKEHGELPTYLMLENVKNLVGKKFKGDFDRWIGKLNELGYNTYWQVLNAKHYGVPQNRERVFAISILREFDMGYAFPEPFDNGVRLKDILEDEVDEKFYISNEKAEKLISQISTKGDETVGIDLTINKPKTIEIANCIKARYDAGISNFKQDGTGVAEIINNIKIPQATTKGYIEIRKLTPLETFRLMGFMDEQFHKAEAVNSNSQLYKQAGNSIVVDVLYYLFENLFLESDTEKLERQVTIFDLGVI